MKIATIAVAALSLAFLAACDRGEPRPTTSASPASGSSAAPVQGQVDPKESAQRKDFQRDGK